MERLFVARAAYQPGVNAVFLEKLGDCFLALGYPFILEVCLFTQRRQVLIGWRLL
jgi:hypothetical protein